MSARQENLETIHQHNVVAERHGLLSELREEIDAGAPIAHQTTLESGSTPARAAQRSRPISALARRALACCRRRRRPKK